MTKICVFGAGAIGGYIGARLAMKGEAEVSLVARGAHLAAMQANGLTLRQAGETQLVISVATSSEGLGNQRLRIATRTGNVHLFDPNSGRSLRCAS